jgi:hypothetical protein
MSEAAVDSSWMDASILCPDTECVVTQAVVDHWVSMGRTDLVVGQRSPAEPEGDGEHQWKECVTCGYQTGWVTTDAVSVGGSGDTCQVGIPEGVRRAASSHAERALAQQAGPPLLQIGRRPEQ